MTILDPDRLIPHSIDAEEAVTGALLIDPAVLPSVRFLEPETFFIERNGWVYAAMLRLHDRGEPIDTLTVTTELEEMGYLHEIGGPAYLLRLASHTPSSLNVEGYARIVKRMWYRREMVHYASRVARLAHSEETDIQSLHQQASELLNTLAGGALAKPTTTRALGEGYLRRLFDAIDANEIYTGYHTGFKALDRLLGHAYGPGTFTAFGAYTSSGKTFLALQMALAAAQQGITTLFVTLESSQETINQRMLSVVSGVPLTAVVTLAARGEAKDRLVEAHEQLSDLPLETDMLETLPEIEARLADMRVRYDFAPAAVFIDDLDSLAAKLRGTKDYEKMRALYPRLLTFALRSEACVVGTKQLLIPTGVNANTSDDTLFSNLQPHIRSYEGGGTLPQKAGNGLVFWSADWIRQKFKSSFAHPQLTPGHIYIRRLRSRDADSAQVEEVALRWEASIPRFEDVPPRQYQPNGRQTTHAAHSAPPGR